MKRYNSPKPAIYYFSFPDFKGHFKPHSTEVEVIGETEKSYRIVLKSPIRVRFVGDELWVAKRKVKIKKEVDVNDFWYNKD